MNKICSRCKKSLKLNSFTKSKISPDGLDYWCRDCKSNYKKENKEVIVARSKRIIEEVINNY